MNKGNTEPIKTISRSSGWAWNKIRCHWEVTVLVILGVTARVGWLLHAKTVPVSDFNDYRTLAIGLVDHLQFGYPEPTSFFLPVHPMYLALFVSVFRSDVWLALAAVAASAAAIPLAYFAALEVLGSKRGAIIASGLFAFFPTFVLFSPVLATEHLFVVLMLGAIIATTKLKDHPTKGALVAGVLLGLAALTRGEAVFYVPAFILFIGIGSGIISRRERARLAAIVVLAVAAVLVPWTIRNAVVVDPESGLSASAGLNFYFAHNDSGNYGDFIEGSAVYGLPPAKASALGWRLGFEHIAAHPLNLLKDVWVGTQRLFAAPNYATFWSTQARASGDLQFTQRYVPLSGTVSRIAALTTAGLISISALSGLAYRSWRQELTLLIVPLILSSWVLRTVVYWANPRYAYFITTMMIFLAALVVDSLLRTPEHSGT